MEIITWTPLLLLLGAGSHLCTSVDPCEGDLQVLDNSESRGPTFEADYEFTPLCDANTVQEGLWFRVSSLDNKRIPETCPDTFRCGTYWPLWIKDQHPKDDSTIVMTVCQHYSGDCCAWEAQVNVKRCPSTAGVYFYIYQLADPPNCNSAYCVESFAPDPVLTSTLTTTETTTPPVVTTAVSCPMGYVIDPQISGGCISRYPDMAGTPSLEGPLLEGEQVSFYCNVHYTRSDPLYREIFSVRFLFDELTVTNLPAVATNRSLLRVKLDQTHLAGRIGKQVSCQAYSYWNHSPTTKSPTLKSSTDYWMGIQLPNGRRDVVISEADDDAVNIRPESTFPVTCPAGYSRCSISLRLISLSDEVQYAYACAYQIRRADWRPADRLASGVTNITIRAKTSPVYRGTETFLLQFEPLNLTPDHIWTGYTVDPITISYHDAQYGLCKVELDTTITTFDGREYTLPAKGQFVLVRSSARRKYEVQIRTKISARCKERACVCGIAVREGHVVLALDVCSALQGDIPRVVIYRYSRELPPGYSVTRNGPGTRYSFNLASGAHVICDVTASGLNVYAYAIGEDYNRTWGLCGVYDGVQGNDPYLLSLREVAPYRINSGTSFFERKLSGDTPDEPDPVYCTCTDPDTVEITCGRTVDPDNYLGAPGMGADGTSTPGSEVTPPIKDPEGPVDDIDVLDLDYEFDPGETFEPPAIPNSWPTPQGKTEAQARAACTDRLTSLPFYQTCRDTANVDNTETVEKCVRAIQRTDSLSAADSFLSGYEQQCVFDASRDGTPRSSDDSTPDPRDAVLAHMCPSNCSGHGLCSERMCVCDEGYIGENCALQSDQAPRLYRLLGGDTCDVRAQPCRHVNILASDVTDVDTLTCRVTLIYYDGLEGLAESTTAALMTSTEVSCALPLSPLLNHTAADPGFPAHTWRVQVSNDGHNFRMGLDFRIWDSKCLECLTFELCTTKDDTCVASGRCFERNDEDTRVPCLWCDPAVSTTSLSSVPSADNRPPAFSGPFNFWKLPGERLEVFLEATDPDGQMNLRYDLAGPSPSNVTLSDVGHLVVGPGSRDITLDVKVMDSCGLAHVEVFRVYSVDCPCKNSRICDGVGSKDPQLFQFDCECSTEDCNAALQTCLSGVCNVTCVSDALRDIEVCSCVGGGSVKRCVPGIAECTSGEDWGTCSKPCDYGFRERAGSCSGVQPTEYELCNTHNCEELPEERYEGVLVVAGVKKLSTIHTVLVKVDRFLEIIRSSINVVCTTEVNRCCLKEVWLNPGKTYAFVPTGFLRNAIGYPRSDEGRLEITFKLLAWLPTKTLVSTCGETLDKRRKRAVPGSNGRHVDDDVIIDAITRSVAQLEQELGVVIVTVNAVQDRESSKVPLTAGVSSAGILIFAIIIVGVVFGIRHYRQRKQSETPKSGPLSDLPEGNPYLNRRQIVSIMPGTPNIDRPSGAKHTSVCSFGTVWDDYDKYEDSMNADYQGIYPNRSGPERESGVYSNLSVEDEGYDDIPVDTGDYRSTYDRLDMSERQMTYDRLQNTTTYSPPQPDRLDSPDWEMTYDRLHTTIA